MAECFTFCTDLQCDQCCENCGQCCYACASSIGTVPYIFCSTTACDCCQTKKKQPSKSAKYTKVPRQMEMSRDVEIQF